MKKLLTSVICSLVTINTVLMAESTRPRLVVGILVDQLRTDYIEYLKTHFGTNGFKKLMTNGVYFRDIDFKVPDLDAVSAAAIVTTGSYPSRNGITASTEYIKSLRREMPVLLNSGSSSEYTPAGLNLSTISDEIAIDGAGLGAIYSIAADPRVAVILAGHAGNSAIWLNSATGRWSVPGYYSGAPQPLSFRGNKTLLASRLDTMQWKPMLKLEEYPGIPAQKKYYPFNYTFPHTDKDTYDKFFLSALGNREVTDIAIEYLNSLRLGVRGDAIDMLNISYSAAPFKYVKDGDYRLELEDTYLRLDGQLERLFNAIDKTVGLDNTLIFLSSTGYYNDAVADDPKYRIPGGEFSIKKALSLLNSYLSATHGNGDYVSYFAGRQLFLNKATIDAKRLKAEDITREAADFLSKMSGVAQTYTLSDIASERSENHRKLKLLIDPKSSGDIYVDFTPGWTLIYDNTFPVIKKPVRSSLAVTPAFFMGQNIDPQTIDYTVDATELAPTMARILRIRSPNGATSRGLTLTR